MTRRKRPELFHLLVIVFVILALLIGGALAFRLSAYHVFGMVLLIAVSIAVGAVLCSWTMARLIRLKRY